MTLLVFIISTAILASFVLLPLSRRSGAPLLLLLLGVGMLLGEDGPGGIDFDNFALAFDLGSLALAIILFAGGLETKKDVFAIAGAPAIVLATLGVLVTAGLVGGAAHLILGMTFGLAMLLGAVVASTDAAATFMLIQQSGVAIRERVRQTLLLESGLNDPVAIFLTVVLTAVVGAGASLGSGDWIDFGLILIKQVTFGLFGGLVGGRLLASLINKLPLPEGTYPALAAAGALSIYSGISMIGGSGFLAVYLAGIVLQSSVVRPLHRITNFNEALQWISQMVLFLMLGLLVTPSALGGGIIDGLMIAAVLTFVARPIAVFVSVGAMKFSIRELGFLSWVGLRGAVPILLAIYPVIEQGPVSVNFFNLVFIIVASSLIVQGWTIIPLARRLKMGEVSD